GRAAEGRAGRRPGSEAGRARKGRTMSTQMARDFRRELAQRQSGATEVTLYWSLADDSVHLEVWQRETGELTFGVARERALDAFYHPFAHVPASGRRTRALAQR